MQPQILPLWVSILSALLVPAITVAGATIAYLQWKTAEKKRRLDLFDKRYVIFKKFEKLLWEIAVSKNGKDFDRAEFIRTIDELPFLFRDWMRHFREDTLAEFFSYTRAIDYIPMDFSDHDQMTAKGQSAKEALCKRLTKLHKYFWDDMKVS